MVQWFELNPNKDLDLGISNYRPISMTDCCDCEDHLWLPSEITKKKILLHIYFYFRKGSILVKFLNDKTISTFIGLHKFYNCLL